MAGYDRNAGVNSSPFHLFYYADAAVIFFFIHSGFILTYAYANEGSRLSAPSYVRFLIERGFRIYPLFLFVLLLSYILRETIYPLSGGSYLSGHFLTFWSNRKGLGALAKEALLVIRIPDEAADRLIPQDWTLTIELLVCPLLPFLALLWRRSRWLFWPLVLIALRFFHFSTWLFEFATGVFIFFMWKDVRRVWDRMSFILRLLVAVAGIVMYACCFHFSLLFTPDHALFSPGMDRFIVVAGCAAGLMIMLCSSRVQRILSYPFLVRIGRCCYSVYIVHLLLLICFAGYGMQVLHGRLAIPWRMSEAILLLLYLAVTTGMSLLTYRFVEQPFNQWGKRVSRRTERALIGWSGHWRRRFGRGA